MTEPEIIRSALRLRERHYPIARIARILKVDRNWLKMRIVPGYREGRLAYEAARRAKCRKKAVRLDIGIVDRAARIDGARLKALVPADTRTLTARICGDPLPGRSALDRKMGMGQ